MVENVETMLALSSPERIWSIIEATMSLGAITVRVSMKPRRQPISSKAINDAKMADRTMRAACRRLMPPCPWS